jgi:hypothetical protein
MDGATIVKVAEKYLGQTEKAGNRGWLDKDFEARMKLVGWASGHSWCAYFAELVWKEAYGPDHKLYRAMDKLFSASSTATYANFSGSALFKVSQQPRPGALVVWRQGTDWRGHIGICTTGPRLGKFDTIEGNTNAAGSREGMYVARKVRRLGEPFKPKGLNLVGFILAP